MLTYAVDKAKKFLCHRLQSGEKVGTGGGIFVHLFLVNVIPCNITQIDTLNDT